LIALVCTKELESIAICEKAILLDSTTTFDSIVNADAAILNSSTVKKSIPLFNGSEKE
jgi:hypothetical protein